MFHCFIATLLSVSNITIKQFINKKTSTCDCFLTILILLRSEFSILVILNSFYQAVKN